MERKLKVGYVGGSSEIIGILSQYPGFEIDQLPHSLAVASFLTARKKADLFICELNVAGGSAFEIYEMVKNVPANSKIPFIIFAFDFNEESFKTAFRSGVDDFYVLPLASVEGFADRVRFLVNFKIQTIVQEEQKPETVEKLKMPVSKRIFDIVVASSALFFLSPLLILIILAIKLESKGKFYYTSKRFGSHMFDFYKLRSMRTGSESELEELAKNKNQYATETRSSDIDFSIVCPKCAALPEGEYCSPILHLGNSRICDTEYTRQKKAIKKSKSTFVKISNDPRVTRVGKFIRNTSIDELPQLINVLKRDMSIVGNRPLPLYEAEILTKDNLAKRFNAPAGITGLWQVELRGKGGVMSEEERNRLDNEYADHFGENYSFWYDLKIILRTIPALFQKDSV